MQKSAKILKIMSTWKEVTKLEENSKSINEIFIR